MTIDAAPDGAFCASTGLWRGARRPARRSRSTSDAAQGNPDRTRREDPPPLLADLDCAVRGSGPFLRVCLGSSVTVSPPRHGSTRNGPTSLHTRPSAGRRRQQGRTPAAGDGERELAGMVMPAAHAGDHAVRVPGQHGAASQWAGPAISWIRCLTMSRTTSSGSGSAAVNRMVPLDSSKAASRPRTASTTWELNGKMLR
jgi:hypothetical protein